MGAYLYDEAVLNKFKAWVGGSNATLLGPDDTRRTLEVIADKNGDGAVKFPLICVRRLPGYGLPDKGKKPLTYDGKMLESTVEKSVSLCAIPITLQYRVDVYTRYYKEADEYMRNIIFNIINFPKISIDIPYQSVHVQHDSSIYINSDVEDLSDISERQTIGQFTRLSVGFAIDDSYLFDARVRDNYSIEFEIKACDTI